MNESGANYTYAQLDANGQTRDQFLAFAVSLLIWSSVVVGVVGAIGNILTIAVYIRLGFSETINMSYTALAVSDLCVIFSVVWSVLIQLPYLHDLLRSYQIRVQLSAFANFTGGWPQLTFSRITAFVTAWISLERSFCVLFPTKAKLFITRNLTRAALTTFYVVSCLPIALAFVKLKIKWAFEPATNISTLYMYYDSKETQDIYNSIAFLLSGAIYPALSWVVILLCTLLLIIKLRRSARWRQANTVITTISNTPSVLKTQQNNLGRRENRITKTVVMIAGFFIVCSLPLSVHILMALVLRKEYSYFGSLKSVFILNVQMTLFITELNSSVNIFFYLITGSKFRSALLQLICLKCMKK